MEAPKGAKRSLRVEVARPPLLPPVVKKAEVELVQAKVQKVVRKVDRSLGQKVDQSLGQKVNRALRVAVARPPLLPPVAKKAEVELVQAKAQKGEFFVSVRPKHYNFRHHIAHIVILLPVDLRKADQMMMPQKVLRKLHQ